MKKIEDLSLSAGISAMSPLVMAKTMSCSESIFFRLPKKPQGSFIFRKIDRAIKEDAYSTNAYKVHLEQKQPEIKSLGGEVRLMNQRLFPVLEGLTAYSLKLTPGGVREPHWHPNAHELNYLLQGSVKITLYSPGGDIETFDMQAGDISFLPRGYLHHIENTGIETAHLVVYFNHVFPSDIGMSGAIGAYPNDLLAAMFSVDPLYFEGVPKIQEDLFVVGGG